MVPLIERLCSTDFPIVEGIQYWSSRVIKQTFKNSISSLEYLKNIRKCAAYCRRSPSI